jgi:hypothetical protein
VAEVERRLAGGLARAGDKRNDEGGCGAGCHHFKTYSGCVGRRQRQLSNV